MRRIQDRLPAAGGFLGPVITLATGTVVAQAVIYASRPVLTRLFTQEAFGIFAFVMAIVAILAPLASARYEDAMMLPEEKEGASNLFALSACIVTALSVASSILILFRMEIAALFESPEIAPWLAAVPLLLFAIGGARLLEAWHNRHESFRAVSAGRITQGVVATILQISLGALAFAAGGLIGGYLAGFAAALLVLGAMLIRHQPLSWPAISRAGMWSLARRYRNFALFSTPAAVLNAATSNLPKLLLLFFFSAEVVGLFWLAFGMLAVPAALIGTSIGQVFFVRAAEARRAASLDALTQRVYSRLVMIGLFPALALIVAGPDLFAFAFGEGWRASGTYARFIALWIFFSSVAAPLTRIFDVLERQRADLGFSVIMFAVQTAALVVGGLTGDVLAAILIFGATGAAVRAAHVAWMLHLAEVPPRAMVGPVVKYLALSVPFLALLALVGHFAGPAALAAAFVVAVAGYLLVAMRTAP